MAVGTAKTESFQFSMATVMVAPMASQLAFDEASHSLGLTKNLMIETSPNVVELTQGMQNDVVFSAINNMNYKCSFEVYEYTPKNVLYAMSLDPGAVVDNTTYQASLAVINPAATTLTITGDVTATYAVGRWGFIQDLTVGNSDRIHIFRVSASAFATGTTTVTFAGFATPAGVTFPANSRVGIVNKIDADPDAANQPFAVRIVGQRVKDKKPITLHFPKARILKGFSWAFNNENFGNLPFEFTPYTPLPTDAGYNSNFNQRMHVFL